MRQRESSKKKVQKQSQTLLEDESKKMQDRLEELRKQLQNKKTVRNGMNNTQTRFRDNNSKEIAKFLGVPVTKNQPKQPTVSELTKFYTRLKMEHLEDTLRQTGIETKQDLEKLQQHEIEKLPIAPGFRIKLKKALIKQSNHEDIESIMERRAQLKEAIMKEPSKFTQLVFDIEEDVFNLNADGQSVRSQTAMSNTSFFDDLKVQKARGQYRKTQKEYLMGYEDHSLQRNKPLRSCLKPKFKEEKEKKIVRFSSQVMQSWDQPHKKYPKEGFTEKIPETPVKQTTNDRPVQYCWGCCKRIKDCRIVNQEYIFCSSSCQHRYLTQYMVFYGSKQEVLQQLQQVSQGWRRHPPSGSIILQIMCRQVDTGGAYRGDRPNLLNYIELYMAETAGSIETLQKKVMALEASNLQQFQKELLQDLYAIRTSLLKAIETIPAGTSGDPTEQEKTIAKLQQENRKQAYRIEHLTRNLRERI